MKTPEEMVVWYANTIKLFLVPPALAVLFLLAIVVIPPKTSDPVGVIGCTAFALSCLALAIVHRYNLRHLYAIVEVTVADQHAYFIKFASGPEMKGIECKSPRFLKTRRWISFLLGSFEKWIETPVTFNMDLLSRQWIVTASLKPDRINEAYHAYSTVREFENAIRNFIVVATRDIDSDSKLFVIRLNEAIRRHSNPKKEGEQPPVFNIEPIREFVCTI